MTKDDFEIANAREIVAWGEKMKHLDDNVFVAEIQYERNRDEICKRITPAMWCFDTMHTVIGTDLMYRNPDRALAPFNRKWGSTWRKLARLSKSWSELCSIYYTTVIRDDLGNVGFNFDKELKKLIIKRYGKGSTPDILFSAYLAWDDCRADPTYRYPADI